MQSIQLHLRQLPKGKTDNEDCGAHKIDLYGLLAGPRKGAFFNEGHTIEAGAEVNGVGIY